MRSTARSSSWSRTGSASGATILPGVPGGAGHLIRAARAADAVIEVAQTAKKLDKVADAAGTGKKLSNAADAVKDAQKAAKRTKKLDPPASGVKKKVNGNSKQSTKEQHGYEIVDTKTGKVSKTGVSGSKLNKNGR